MHKRSNFIMIFMAYLVLLPNAFASSTAIQLGEKLFREPRFSHYFYQHSKGRNNSPLESGDPVLETIKTDLGIFDHPYRGSAMSCAACHFLDQAASISQTKVLTYNDFSQQTSISEREDGLSKSVRNTSNMVGSMVKEGAPLHWDGEFFSGKDLACASLTGRNMGWLPTEAKMAKSHIVNVLRTDNGRFDNDVDLKLAYSEAFENLGIHIQSVSDDELFSLSCKFIYEFMQSLDFSRDGEGYNGSAYDQFLNSNGLRRSPREGQSTLDYVEELKDKILSKTNWTWILPKPMKYHSHPAQFGDLELEGMKTFFGQGQCVSCHTPPHFTDFGFHTIGTAQLRYEQVHGYRTFSQLKIPSHKERLRDKDTYLVATAENPFRKGVFRRGPSIVNPLFADLGVWNMFGHPDKARIQEPLKAAICRSLKFPNCEGRSDAELLDKTVGMFKTPTLRSLGQSAPYFSDGSATSIKHVLQAYMVFSAMAKRDLMVNEDPVLNKMTVRAQDFAALQAFLEALDEDYD